MHTKKDNNLCNSSNGILLNSIFTQLRIEALFRIANFAQKIDYSNLSKENMGLNVN